MIDNWEEFKCSKAKKKKKVPTCLERNVIHNYPYIVSGLQVLKEFEKGVGMKQ